MQNLYTAESGLPENPAILFLHGSPLTGRMWQPQMDRLSEFYCLAPDLPRHGNSAAIPTQSLASVSEKVANLIRTRVPSGWAHIVGLSYGGVVAQGILKYAPEVVKTMVLSGTSDRMPRWLAESQRLNEPFMRLMKPQQLAALVCLQFGVPKKYQQSLSADFASFSASTLMEVLMTYTEIPDLAENKLPVLVMVGSAETIYAKMAARKLSKTIPGARGYSLPGLGHVWNLQAPDLFVETLRAWIGGTDLPNALVPLPK